MSRPELKKSIEAILMVVDEPISEVVLAQITEIPTEEVVAELHEMARSYEEEGRGFQLRQVAGGWRYYSHPDQNAVVEKFVLDGQQSRLTQAALETLSVIAYRQPVTRADIEVVRGVAVLTRQPRSSLRSLELIQWKTFRRWPHSCQMLMVLMKFLPLLLTEELSLQL